VKEEGAMVISAAARVLSVLTGLALAVLGLLALPATGAAEEFEATHCLGGTITAFHGSQEVKSLSTWTGNGIVRSSNKRFDNVATHCAGVGRAGEGYGLCKMVDGDGDIIVTAGPYAGSKGPIPIVEGTGKWKGITGSIDAERIAAAKPAVPGSFQFCSAWKGKYEVRR
jgi:hypothetical protein